jgi:hypothetical protein
VWTVPGKKMKMGSEFRVPLCEAAQSLLASLPRNGDYIFGGGQPLSSDAMDRLLKRRLNVDATVRRVI